MGRGKAWGMIQRCRSRWLWWTESTVRAGQKCAAFLCKALVKCWEYPDLRSLAMIWLPESTSVQLWCPVPVSLPPPANPSSAQSLVFWRLDDTTPGWHNSMYISFLACSGHCPGMEESLCEMLCEPESARVAVPKCTCSGPCFYSQSWRESDGGLSWKCSMTWIQSVLTWGCDADLSEMGRVGLCIFPSPTAEILPGIRQGNVKYPAQSAAAYTSSCT